MPERLLAKSRAHGELTLERHLCETDEAAVALFGEQSRWADAWRRFFKLDEANWRRFVLEVRVAALFHDLGKASRDFFDRVAGHGRTTQTIRHEHLSAFVLCTPAVTSWLSQTVDVDIVRAAVLSHHLKASRQEVDDHAEWLWGEPQGNGVVETYFAHPEVDAVMKRIGRLIGRDDVPAFPSEAWDIRKPVWSDARRNGHAAADRFARALRTDIARRNRLLAVKAGVIAADAVSSALFRIDRSIDEWVQGIVGDVLTADEIAREVTSPRIAALREQGKWHGYHRFQEGAAALEDRALLLAGCGMGKTLAAWRWIESVATRRPVGRVVFLYPTRGTATEGFRDYVGWAPETRASLVHGTAGYELKAIRDNPSESTRDKNYEVDDRLFALGLWSKRYFSATVDQFLGFVEHQYRSLCLLPVLADAVVVLDEVHSYDAQLWRNTIAILDAFDVPVLAMTATLSSKRRSELEARGFRAYPSAAEKADQLQDLVEREAHPRYRIVTKGTLEGAYRVARDALAAGRRVLWVANRVASAQRIARALDADGIADVICYHSRFRLEDRKTRHAATVAAFQSARRPVVAVTTQVCEMSLDLDADVVITERAPASSLVQRFGRGNRHLDPRREPDKRADVYVYDADETLPYTKKDLAAADEFLAALSDEPSQSELASALENVSTDESRADGAARFLESGYFAVPGPLRDIDDSGQAAVLDQDLPAILRALAERSSIDGFVLPARARDLSRDLSRPAQLPAWIGIVRAAQYDERFGLLQEAI
jgi:CRISPR-associated endonuclease/helicase Cas3